MQLMESSSNSSVGPLLPGPSLCVRQVTAGQQVSGSSSMEQGATWVLPGSGITLPGAATQRASAGQPRRPLLRVQQPGRPSHAASPPDRTHAAPCSFRCRIRDCPLQLFLILAVKLAPVQECAARASAQLHKHHRRHRHTVAPLSPRGGGSWPHPHHRHAARH